MENPGESPFGCYISEAVQNPHYRYRYTRRELRFPSPALGLDGSTLQYRLRLQEPGKEPVFVANCVIPRTRTAVRLLEQWLRVPEDVRYTVTHSSGRTETRTTSTGEDPCSSKFGDTYVPPGETYEEDQTCFTIDGITATGKPQPQEPSTEPASPPPPSMPADDSPSGGGGGTGGGDQPCYDCQYDSSGTLGCTPSVRRGGTVTCSISAAKQAEANIVVHLWAFADAVGRTVQTSDQIMSWSGTAVVGGTVTIRFDDGAGVREVVSNFAVTDRGWNWANNAESTYGDGTGPACLSHPPTFGWSNGVNLPMNAADCGTGERMIQPDSYAPAGDGFAAATVSGGPNYGFHYIQSARLYLRRQSTYNLGLRSDASQVLLNDAQQQSACGSWVNWYAFTRCIGTDPEGYIAGARAHEGYGTTGHNGHFSAAYDAAADPSNDPMAFFDQQVGSNYIDLGTFIQDVRRGFYPRAERVDIVSSDHGIVTGNYSGPYCGWLAFEGRFHCNSTSDT